MYIIVLADGRVYCGRSYSPREPCGWIELYIDPEETDRFKPLVFKTLTDAHAAEGVLDEIGTVRKISFVTPIKRAKVQFV